VQYILVLSINCGGWWWWVVVVVVVVAIKTLCKLEIQGLSRERFKIASI
jgi:hypothetical protein